MNDLSALRLAKGAYTDAPVRAPGGTLRCAIHRDAWRVPVIPIQGTENFREVMVDLQWLPGLSRAGYRAHRGIVRETQRLVDWLARIPDLAGPVVFIGHSLGGGAAIEAAMIWPHPGAFFVAFDPPAYAWGNGLSRAVAARGMVGRAYCHANDVVVQQPPWWLGFREIDTEYFGRSGGDDNPVSPHELTDWYFHDAAACASMQTLWV